MHFRYALVVLILSCFTAFPVAAQNTVHLITFGKQAKKTEGDDDFTQVIFIRVPATLEDKLYVRIFDPDVGGAWDEVFGTWDTRTRFRLFGNVEPTAIGKDKYTQGTLLADKSFGEDSRSNSHWQNLHEITARQGGIHDGYAYFRLLVEGMEGDDGNLFDIAVSLDPKLNRLTEGVKILNYRPALSLPQIKDRFAELRFFIPGGMTELNLSSFDLENNPLWFETPFRSDYPLKSSGQGEWMQNKITLETGQTGQYGAITVQTNAASYNNAVFQVFDKDNKPLPLELPVRLQRYNERPQPLVDVRFVADCSSVVLDASHSTDKEGQVLSYIWDFGDGQSGTGGRTVHRYAKPGVYQGEVVVSDDSGRIAASTRKPFKLRINEPPIVDGGPSQTGAPGQILEFNAGASYDPDGKISRYTWYFGEGVRIDRVAAQHAYTRPGLYYAQVRVEDDSQSLCNSATARVKVWINDPPVVVAGDNQIAAVSDELRFDAARSFDSDGEIVEYLWDFGDGKSGTGREISHRYEKPGEYTVTLTAVDNANVANSRRSDHLKVVINQQPVAKAAVQEQHMATGEALYFNARQSFDADGHLTAWEWDFGDGAKAAGESVSHAYSQPGTYTVKVTVTDNSGTVSATAGDSLQVVINRPPQAEAGPDQKVTASEVQFDGSASQDGDGQIIAWDWDFGDGNRGSGPKPIHIYRAPGTYKVTLRVTDGSGTSSRYHEDSMSVLVNQKPIADAGPDQTGVPGVALNFDATGSFDVDGTVAQYHWDFGDGEYSDKAQTTHTYAKPGSYSARLRIADDSGHTNALGFDEALITVNAPPKAKAGTDVFAAPGEEITFDGSASFDPDGALQTYQWRFSDGQSPAQQVLTRRAFKQPGVYQATLDVSDNSGASNARASDSLNIRINHRPHADAGKNINTCAHAVDFDASASTDGDGDRLAYTWDFGDDSPPASGIKVRHTYAKAGNYPVRLSVNDGSGLSNASDSKVVQVFINQAPLADAGGHRTACAGEPVLFNGSASIDAEGGRLRYLWQFAATQTVESVNPVYLYKKGGLYPVVLTVQDDSGLQCDRHSDPILVRVAEAPLADAGPDQEVCANTPVQFDGSGSSDFDGVVNAFDWDFGDGNNAQGQKTTHLFSLPGKYRVRLTITGDRVAECNNQHTDEALVHVADAPVAVFSSAPIVGLNIPAQFDASASSSATAKLSYAWDFGDGSKGDGVKPEHTYTKAGKYFVTLTVKSDTDSRCNQSEIRKPLLVNAPPQAEAGESRHAGVYEELLFDASGSNDPDGIIADYLWDFGDGNTAHARQARHQYSKPGEYTVTLTVKDDAGIANSSHSDTLKVNVNAPPQPLISPLQDIFCRGVEIPFDGSGSSDSDGAIQSWQWDFGDGTQKQGSRVSHTYQQHGQYNLSLTVDDGSPALSRTGKQVKTIRINQPPQADAGAPQRVCKGQTFTLDASASNDADGKLTAYQWELGDGNTAQGKKVRYRYEKTGTYLATVTVQDDSASACATAQAITETTVNNQPTASAGGDRTVFTGGAHDAVLFDATASADADHNPLTYAWFFDGKTPVPGAQVYYTFPSPGVYKVLLRVRDNSGTTCNEAWDKITVTVKPRKN